MDTRQRILAAQETLSDLEFAAEDRFVDAETLMRGGRTDGAVYLLGLAAEMWLKVACSRVAGFGPAGYVTALLGPAQQWMKVHAPAIPRESYHSLMFWSEYLILLRKIEKVPLPANLAGELRHHVESRLFRDWKIDLRYRPFALSERQARRAYHDVSWLRLNHSLLWR